MKQAVVACAIAVGLMSVASVASAQGGKLTADDYLEIQQLYVKYAHTIDLGDAEGWADTFTPDGVFAGSKGRDQLIEFAEGIYGRGGTTRHWNSQVLITPTAEGADGSCYLLMVDTATQPPNITVSGIYRDKLVKTANGWRFKSRDAAIEPPAGSR